MSHVRPRSNSPGSRATAAAGVRLITVDRPGVGGTDPTRAAPAADVVALLDALELDAVDLVGWSGGGQFALVEAVRQGPAGSAFDIVAGLRDANLPAPRIRARLFYGDDDQQVGVEHGRWYAERLGAQLTVVPGAGHLLPLDHWTAVLSAAQGQPSSSRP